MAAPLSRHPYRSPIRAFTPQLPISKRNIGLLTAFWVREALFIETCKPCMCLYGEFTVTLRLSVNRNSKKRATTISTSTISKIICMRCLISQKFRDITMV
ncbi:uncharacterized protein H6S33_002726 [Morchella sextelata]|uniref:uncharacterized protein n=1 Tax=Morchella sextelata TaxID=1174677 RepID=UPI001D049E98|nr:uncharacterized protein H6S33_002726 [Morchella sextelata]KAH0607692.1 hypothetical protein H6S33_002726 [Morchella sextelata]